MPSKRKRFLSLKYQVLIALGATLALSFATFFLSARRIFIADKKLLVRDLNLALMDGAYGSVTKSVIQRGSEVVQSVANTRIAAKPTKAEVAEFFGSFRPPTSEEILRVTFLKKTSSDRYEKFSEYRNDALVAQRGFADTFFLALDAAHPSSSLSALQDRTVSLQNISVSIASPSGEKPFYGMRLTLPARTIKEEGVDWLVQVDMDQSFMIYALKASDLSDIFLVSNGGNLVSHSDPVLLMERGRFEHPLMSRLSDFTLHSESVEVEMGNETYLASVRDAGFPGMFLIAQIPASEITQSMRQLLRSTTVSAILILYLAFIGSIFFSTGLTVDLKRLASAARLIGQGNFDIHLGRNRSKKVIDEVEQLSEGFEVMAAEIQDLLLQTAEKSRMEAELKTASLLQSTVLITPEVVSDDFRVANCYIPATECSGDFLDAFMVGRTVYFAVADATGHGVAAALVTGVAKSCLLTLRNVHADSLPSPEVILSELNRTIYGACKGKLMMTMCLVQLDLDTGKLRVANAGHEAPFCLRAAEAGPKQKPEEFFVRGERLGFSPDSQYTYESYELAEGDTLLLYTDGVSEAVDARGAEWGERQLKKAFTKSIQGGTTVEAVRDMILRELRTHTGSELPHDDVTFSVFRYQPAKLAAA